MMLEMSTATYINDTKAKNILRKNCQWIYSNDQTHLDTDKHARIHGAFDQQKWHFGELMISLEICI